MKCRFLPAIFVGLLVVAPPTFAQDAGSWTFGFGVHNVDPKSDNGSVAGNTLDVRAGSSTRPTVTAEYFFKDNWGVEAIAAWPFEHDISIDGVGKVGSTKHLPPTISLQYHFGKGKVRPFVGAGINYTAFFSEKTSGALAGSDLDLGNSWGLAGHVGLDFAVSDTASIRVDARWIDIDTDVSLDGADIGTVNIDPLVYGAAYVVKF